MESERGDRSPNDGTSPIDGSGVDDLLWTCLEPHHARG